MSGPASAQLDARQLRAQMSGRVIEPGDDDYESARVVFFGNVDKRPRLIARPANHDDVARVLTYARETGSELAIRSGGHDSAGHSTADGGIVVDLRDLRSLEIDVQRREAWAGSGLTSVDYSIATAVHGLVTGFGDTGSVGLGGLVLGGGVGYLVRKYGLTIDDLIAAEIVTADGAIRLVDAEHEPDLFWAIRGGGGNFGVATRFRLRLHDLPTAYGGMLMLPATAETIHSFVALAESAPDELSVIGNVMPAPPMPFVPVEHHGKLVIMALVVYAGDPGAGERTLAPFRALAAPIVDLLKPMKYHEIYPPEDPSYRPVAASRTLFVDAVDRSSADAIVEHLGASRAFVRVAQLRVLGGASARVPDEATAYAHRKRRLMVNVAALYQRPDEAEEHQRWVEGFASAIQRGPVGAYVNFLGNEGQGRVRDAYPGTTWDRLARIKRRYDPENVFRLNQNVPPAS